jgi:imidazoleglycerol-phosphate dehydratase/histidinol-phosphatase
MKKRAVFVMTEGALLDIEGEGFQRRNAHFMRFVPGVIGALALLARNKSFDLFLVAKQDSVQPRESQERQVEFSAILSILEGEGIVFTEILPDVVSGGDVERFCLSRGYDLQDACIVADASDGCSKDETFEVKRRLLDCDEGTTWARVAQEIVAAARSTRVRRMTSETSIELGLSLERGLGVAVSTGLGFFDHMLTLLFVHAGFSADLCAKGDLHVDEHHLVEDVGLVLGQAIREALGEKRGISRYGFVLPMDESLAEIAMDLAGRYEFIWHVTWAREKLGDLPTELIRHFFKSLAESLRCSLHMSVRGDDQHHKAEALFKGVGRVLRTACACEAGTTEIPSSKGVL